MILSTNLLFDGTKTPLKSHRTCLLMMWYSAKMNFRGKLTGREGVSLLALCNRLRWFCFLCLVLIKWLLEWYKIGKVHDGLDIKGFSEFLFCFFFQFITKLLHTEKLCKGFMFRSSQVPHIWTQELLIVFKKIALILYTQLYCLLAVFEH